MGRKTAFKGTMTHLFVKNLYKRKICIVALYKPFLANHSPSPPDAD